jgi:hypothetical protein
VGCADIVGTRAGASLEFFVLLERDLCPGIVLIRVGVGSYKYCNQKRACCLLGMVVEALDTAADRSLPGFRDLLQQRTGTSKVANPSLLKHQEGLLLAFFGLTDIDSWWDFESLDFSNDFEDWRDAQFTFCIWSSYMSFILRELAEVVPKRDKWLLVPNT